MAPPAIEAAFSQRALKKCPINTPTKENTKVMQPITTQDNIMFALIKANAKPTIKASRLVARPSISNSKIFNLISPLSSSFNFFARAMSSSLFPRKVSQIIFPPRKTNKIKATNGAFAAIAV